MKYLILFYHQFKDDEISSDCDQIKIRTQSERITFKKLFKFNQKIE